MAKVKSYMNPNIPKPKPRGDTDAESRRITKPVEPPRRGERPGPTTKVPAIPPRRGERPGPTTKVPAKPMPKPKPKPRFRPLITKGGR